MNAYRWTRVCAAAALCAAMGTEAVAAGPYALVTGRRDPAVTVIDLGKALLPANNATANAVISRARVTPDVDTDGDGVADTPAAGLPSNIVIPPQGRYAYVVNHAGTATPAQVAFFQHGWAGNVAVLDLMAALDPANSGTVGAVHSWVPSGAYGPVGLALTPDLMTAFVAHSEGNGTEDGAREVNVLDLRSGQVVQSVKLALGNGGEVLQGPGKSCAALANDPASIPFASPNGDIGCFPDSNAIVVSPMRGGYAFVANGGTDDVSVLDMRRLLAGRPDAEVRRIATGVGPWGLAINSGGGLVAVGNRESAETGIEGNTISLIDVSRAITGRNDAVVASVRVGTDGASTASRPFGLAFTPDGRRLLVANFRTNNLSIVDVRRALAGDPQAEVGRIALARPDGGPGRPRGVALTPDGKFAAVSGGAANAAGGGTLWMVDLDAAAVVATVTGVGNEPYLLQVTHGPAQ
jgi:DNA-binding beta-propeller fold protein YncE